MRGFTHRPSPCHLSELSPGLGLCTFLSCIVAGRNTVQVKHSEQQGRGLKLLHTYALSQAYSLKGLCRDASSMSVPTRS